MKKAQALLDSLMGPSRNVSKKERTGDEFLGENVCKNHLVGFCPHMVYGGRIDVLEGKCKKLHSVAMQGEFQKHKDYDRYRKEYEDHLIKSLTQICVDADAKGARENRKKRPPQKVIKIPDHLKIKLSDAEVEKQKFMKKAAEARASGDGPGASAAEDEVGKLQEQIEETKKAIEEDTHTLHFPGEQVCEVCGDRFLAAKWGEYQDVINFSVAIATADDHLETDGHKCFVAIRERLQKLKDKRRSEGAPDASDKGYEDRDRDEEKRQSREGGGSDGKGRDDDGDRGRRDDDGDRRRRRDDGDEDDGRRSRDRDRDNDRGNRRRGSRGRDDYANDRDRYRDRDRGGRDRETQRRRDDRSRTPERRRSDSRDRDRDRRRW